MNIATMNSYRSLLLELSNSLTTSDLHELKFLCGDVIPAGKAEKITRGFELFVALEQLNMLSEEYRDLLASKLIAINRVDLRNKLVELHGNPVEERQHFSSSNELMPALPYAAQPREQTEPDRVPSTAAGQNSYPSTDSIHVPVPKETAESVSSSFSRLSYTSIKEKSKGEIDSEFVMVPRDLKGHVIGKKRCMLQVIMQTSGAIVSSQSKEQEGFTVYGDEEQRACAKRLIVQKVNDVKCTMRELVKIEDKYKGLVIGKRCVRLREISAQTGAEMILNTKDGGVYIILGNEEQRKHAKVQIGEIVSGGRIRGVENEFNKLSCYIDSWNLLDTKLKLKQVLQKDCIKAGFPAGLHAQYRLKSAEENEAQESCSSDNYASYRLQLMKDVLLTLRKIKSAAERPKADMWCHLGTSTVRVQDQEEVQEREWSIDEATGKFESSNREHNWKLGFKEAVGLNEGIFKGHYKERIPDDIAYVARYDLTFLTPCWHQVRCKVWITNNNAGERLVDIPIPLSDVKNILEDIHFEDAGTRSRCRGWLVLRSRMYLQAYILFPGCEFDGRFTIRGRTDSAQTTDSAPKEEVRIALLTYLSGLTWTDDDEFGLRLPEKDIPEGFHLVHKRYSKRTEYTTDPGFDIILSKEHIWHIGIKESRESTDVRLHCGEWDTLLSSGDWEPKVVVEKLPEFLQFVKEVQVLLFHEMKRTGLTETIPPEILARGASALEAYKKALADGKTSNRRLALMLIGQDQAGKTSTKKSLKGICFDPEEDSTVGIDVDPSHFKVSTEIWKTGTKNQDQNSDTAISFDCQTARCIVDILKTEGKSTEVNIATEESSNSFSSEITEMPGDPRPTEPSRDAEHIPTYGDPASIVGRHEPHVSSDPAEQNQENVNVSTPNVPEEVAAIAESLLRGDLEDNKEDVYSTLWDFAGQSVYYVTHPLFLTARAIYCLVYDLSLNPHDKAKPLVKQGVYKQSQESFNLKTNLDYLHFWMMSVSNLDLANCQEESCDVGPKSGVLPEKLPPVFLVCTHADTPYDGRNPRALAREIFGCLKNKPYGAQLSGVFVVDNTSLSVNKSECPEVQRLRKEVLAVAKELPHVNEAIPIKWLKFEKTLQAVKEKGHKYISLDTAKGIASNVCNIDEDKELETLINYLHDLRSLIHFNDTSELNKLVILDPQWLVDVFKKVITIKPFDCEETKFLELWCKLEKEGILDEKLLTHVWGALFNNKETSDSLIRIMEKFSLLCPWPSDALNNKNYLVPSMLKSHPSTKILELVASSKIPPLFIKFENGQVPPGFFPRLVLQFFQWGKGKLWRPVNPQLFHNFARFYTTEDDYSVILVCHPLSVEVVVHGGNLSLELAEDLSSRMTLSADFHHDTAGFTCARVVRRQLGLILGCMRNEFRWLRNMRYELGVICPVCCEGGAVKHCQTHDTQGCKEEQCLHFWSENELCCSKVDIVCTRSATAQNTTVQVIQFEPWFSTQGQQLAISERDGGIFPCDEGNEEKALALPDDVLHSLLSKSCDSKQVVIRLKATLQLDQASLEQPDPGTKRWIRCLARKAKGSDRLDVVEHLREITPAGTTGPLLSETLDARRIPISQGRKLTIALCGGDEWMLVAEKLGLSPDEIRYLDKRTLNPADALIGYIANRRYVTVGELYDVLNDCKLQVIADKL